MYYQETTADKYSNFLAIPLLIYLFIALLVEKLKYSLKDNRLLDALKHSLTGVIGIGIGYYFILTPVISGTIIMTNDILREGQGVLLKGVITEIRDIKGPKLSTYELTVKTEDEELVFDTDGIEIKKYRIGDTFELEMKKGFWGLMTKQK